MRKDFISTQLFTNIVSSNRMLDGIGIIIGAEEGNYMPQVLAKMILNDFLPVQDVNTDDIETCMAGPTEDNEFYWEAFNNILSCELEDVKGYKYYFHILEDWGDLCIVHSRRMEKMREIWEKSLNYES